MESHFIGAKLDSVLPPIIRARIRFPNSRDMGFTRKRLPFPRKDPAKPWHLLAELRDLSGKRLVAEEDRLRSASLRASAELRRAGRSWMTRAFPV